MNSGKAICTIIAKNYIAHARTLCNSFLDLYPEGNCHVLFVDDTKGFLEVESERFKAYHLHELGIPDLRDFCFKYTVTEICTAVKPYFLRFLLETARAGKVVYLDPDILVLNRLDNIFDAMEEADVLLTPHLDTDYPDDGAFPDDGHILKSGIFNLGFIAVRKSENASRFLKWWEGKLYDKCIIDHARGYFVDQRFIDLAYTLFDNMKIVRDTGHNVAYWNLHSRSVEYREGMWICNGSPLYFFHFSNYKPGDPELLSGYQNRIRLSDRPYLKMLYSLYTEKLLENGYAENSRWPYTHGSYADGNPIRDETRRVYRVFRGRSGLGDPFDRRSHPLLLRLAAALAGIYGWCRLWVRNRAVYHDGLLRKLAKTFYGPFPSREG